jgi:soluble lytic murein transglycosylase-like protein
MSKQNNKFVRPLQLLAVAISCLLSMTTVQSLPIYTDALWLDNGRSNASADVLQQRAAQVRRLTDYIQETFRLSRHKTVAIVSEAVYNAGKNDLDPALVLAVIAVESTFRERVVSHAGARGLMQVMPEAHPEKVRAIGGVDALFDPRKNIATGARILLEYLNMSGGNLRRALLRYNGSLANPQSEYPGKVMGLYRKFRQLAQLDKIS